MAATGRGAVGVAAMGDHPVHYLEDVSRFCWFCWAAHLTKTGKEKNLEQLPRGAVALQLALRRAHCYIHCYSNTSLFSAPCTLCLSLHLSQPMPTSSFTPRLSHLRFTSPLAHLTFHMSPFFRLQIAAGGSSNGWGARHTSMATRAGQGGAGYAATSATRAFQGIKN